MIYTKCLTPYALEQKRLGTKRNGFMNIKFWKCPSVPVMLSSQDETDFTLLLLFDLFFMFTENV